MAFSMAGMSATLFSILSSFLFWGILLVIALVVIWGALVIRKRRKLIYPAIEMTDLGAGKVGFKSYKAGWFKTKVFLGLYDYGGEDVLKLKDGRIVQDASSEDFHEINGRRGLLVVRKSDDPAILLPINKAGTSDNYEKKPIYKEILKKIGEKTTKENIKDGYQLAPVKRMDIINPELLLEIAPADYRDASGKIIFDAEKETRSKWEKLAPYLVFGTMAIVFMVCIILIVQMVKQGQAEAKDTLLEAGRMGADQLKVICRGVVSEATSTVSFEAP